MTEHQQDVLRVEPDMIPALRIAFKTALHQLNDSIVDLSRKGFIPEPWLGDESSTEVVTHYTQRAMEEPDSSYQSLIAYHAELNRVHDTLQQMEDDYRRREGDNAALWGRLA